MKRMSGQYAPGYDLFKLIVAVILTIVLIALLLSNREQQSPALLASPTLGQPTATESMPVPPSPTADMARPATLAFQRSLTSIAQYPSGTLTATLQPTDSPPTPSPTETIPSPQATLETLPTEDTSTPTTVPVATEPTPTSQPGRGGGDEGCPSVASRIEIGDNLRVLVRLNFRSGPGLGSPIILTNKPGTTLQVIGGPACTPLSALEGPPRAYLWWNVRMEDGLEGWSAEAWLISPNYFLEPMD